MVVPCFSEVGSIRKRRSHSAFSRRPTPSRTGPCFGPNVSFADAWHAGQLSSLTSNDPAVDGSMSPCRAKRSKAATKGRSSPAASRYARPKMIRMTNDRFMGHPCSEYIKCLVSLKSRVKQDTMFQLHKSTNGQALRNSPRTSFGCFLVSTSQLETSVRDSAQEFDPSLTLRVGIHGTFLLFLNRNHFTPARVSFESPIRSSTGPQSAATRSSCPTAKTVPVLSETILEALSRPIG